MTVNDAETLLSLLNVLIRENDGPDELIGMARRLSQSLYGTLLAAEINADNSGQRVPVGNIKLGAEETVDRNVADEIARREREIK